MAVTKLRGSQIIPHVQTVTSASTVTPNADTDDAIEIIAQAGSLTLANPSGTPSRMQSLIIYIKDNNTPQAITYGSQYRGIGITLPTTTTAGKIMCIGALWDANDTKWNCTGLSIQA